MSSAPYQPIACSLYDLFEIAIMRGDELVLYWQDELGIEHSARVKPVGLQTQAGEEFLLMQRDSLATNPVERIRLDQIRPLK